MRRWMPMAGYGPRRRGPRHRELAPARGIARGVIFGLVVWLILLAFWLF